METTKKIYGEGSILGERFTTEHSYIPIVRAPCASAVVVKPIASCCLSLPGLVNKQFAIAIKWPFNYSGFTH